LVLAAARMLTGTTRIAGYSPMSSTPAAAPTGQARRPDAARPGGVPVPQGQVVPGVPELAVAAVAIGGVLVVVVRGVLCSRSRGELAAALDWALTDHPRIVIDASGIDHCDAAGLAPIVDAAARGADRGVRVVMSGLDQRHHRCLPADCTGDLFYPSLTSALTATGGHTAPHPRGVPGRSSSPRSTPCAA
jgi:anti-anti-sigma regulatory factor